MSTRGGSDTLVQAICKLIVLQPKADSQPIGRSDAVSRPLYRMTPNHAFHEKFPISKERCFDDVVRLPSSMTWVHFSRSMGIPMTVVFVRLM